MPKSSFGEEPKKEGKNSGIIAFPFVAYSPETKIMGGIGGIYFHRPDSATKDKKPSQLSFFTAYTQKKQFSITLNPSVYFKDELYNLSAEMGFAKFPDKFFGVGNDTPDSLEEEYTPQNIEMLISLKRKIKPQLSMGIGWEMYKHQLKEYEEGGLLEMYKQQGLVENFSSAAMITAELDTRDNLFYPRKGCFHRLSFSSFNEIWGSDTNFERYRLDLRRYHSILGDKVIAFRYYLEVNAGEVPITMMPKFGGGKLARGYYEGRYIDKNLMSIIGEYRAPLWKRVGYIVFAGIGDVTDEVENFRLKDFKYTFGGGLRFILNKEENITLRVDYGIGDGVSNFYFQSFEAF